MENDDLGQPIYYIIYEQAATMPLEMIHGGKVHHVFRTTTIHIQRLWELFGRPLYDETNGRIRGIYFDREPSALREALTNEGQRDLETGGGGRGQE